MVDGTASARKMSEQPQEMLLDPPLKTVRSYAVTCQLCYLEVVSGEVCLTTANEIAYEHLRTEHTDWKPVYKAFSWDDDVLEEGNNG